MCARRLRQPSSDEAVLVLCEVIWADAPVEVGTLVSREGIAVISHGSMVGVGCALLQFDFDC